MKLVTPGYHNNYPLLQNIRKIKTILGYEDSCIQTTEAAILFLAEKGSEDARGQREFIIALCQRYQISPGTTDFQALQKKIRTFYIVQTYSVIEPFFKKLNEEYRRWHQIDLKSWKTKSDKEDLDPFGQLIENLPVAKSNGAKKYPEFCLLHYFRMVRNSVIHLYLAEEKYEKTGRYYKTFLAPHADFFAKNYNISAPNPPDAIIFADFVLYTRALKYYLNIINDLCFPSIAKIVSVASLDPHLQKELKKHANVKHDKILHNRIKAIQGYFTTNFNAHHPFIRDEFCRAYLTAEHTDYSRFENTLTTFSKGKT